MLLFILKVNDIVDIEDILIKNSRRINVKTKDNFYIYFNPEKDVNIQLENYKAVLGEYILKSNKKLNYIDLRFENKVYYRYLEN